MDDLERLKSALRRADLPDWILETRIEPVDDEYGENAVYVHVVIRDERDDVLRDGQLLNRTAVDIQGIAWSGPLRWLTYVDFVSSADAA